MTQPLIDQLAQEIRRVDGNHDKGAAALAEALIPSVVPRSVAEDLSSALRAVLSRDERNTCRHDETHRGGFLWEICDQCGAKWADDEGGRPEFTEPVEWVQARQALARLKETQS